MFEPPLHPARAILRLGSVTLPHKRWPFAHLFRRAVDRREIIGGQPRLLRAPSDALRAAPVRTSVGLGVAVAVRIAVAVAVAAADRHAVEDEPEDRRIGLAQQGQRLANL